MSVHLGLKIYNRKNAGLCYKNIHFIAYFFNMTMFLQMKTQDGLGSNTSAKQTWQTLIMLYF